MVQSIINVAAALGACSGPLIIGALSRYDPANGWRKFYVSSLSGCLEQSTRLEIETANSSPWFQMALWGATAICIQVGYRPLKRYTEYDDQPLSQKIKALDLVGVGLFTAGLTLFLVGLGLGGELNTWTDVRVLATLLIGIVTLLGFFLHEWKGTKRGIAHHDLFRGVKNAGRTFALFVSLIFIEGVLLFSFLVYYPVL